MTYSSGSRTNYYLVFLLAIDAWYTYHYINYTVDILQCYSLVDNLCFATIVSGSTYLIQCTLKQCKSFLKYFCT